LKLWASRWTGAVKRRDNGKKHMKKHLFRVVIAAALIGPVLPVYAQGGFYGGVSLRPGGADATGLTLGGPALVWNRFVAPVG
jgi:hypothetical protein